MTRFTAIAPALLLAATLLAACSPGTEPDPVVPAGPTEDAPCVVGAWQLDVADYAAQSEDYLVGLAIPITEFAMSGDGTIVFTADGLVSTDIALRTTGVLVAGDVSVPIDVPSAYTATGDWSPGTEADAIDLTNWSTVADPDVTVPPDGPPIPAIDYSDVPSVLADCTADTLVLAAPDAPLTAVWHR